MQQPTPPATPVLTPDQLPVAPVQDNQGGFALSPEMERLRAGRLRRNKFSNIADALGGIGLSLSALGKGQTITENPFTAKIEARRREQEAYESFTGSEALADLPLEQQREVVSALETFGVEAAAGILSRHRQTNAQQAFQIQRDEAGFANDKELALLRASLQNGAGNGKNTTPFAWQSQEQYDTAVANLNDAGVNGKAYADGVVGLPTHEAQGKLLSVFDNVDNPTPADSLYRFPSPAIKERYIKTLMARKSISRDDAELETSLIEGQLFPQGSQQVFDYLTGDNGNGGGDDGGDAATLLPTGQRFVNGVLTASGNNPDGKTQSITRLGDVVEHNPSSGESNVIDTIESLSVKQITPETEQMLLGFDIPQNEIDAVKTIFDTNQEAFPAAFIKMIDNARAIAKQKSDLYHPTDADRKVADNLGISIDSFAQQDRNTGATNFQNAVEAKEQRLAAYGGRPLNAKYTIAPKGSQYEGTGLETLINNATEEQEVRWIPQGKLELSNKKQYNEARKVSSLVESLYLDDNLAGGLSIEGRFNRFMNALGIDTGTALTIQQIKQMDAQAFVNGINGTDIAGSLTELEGIKLAESWAALGKDLTAPQYQEVLADIAGQMRFAEQRLLKDRYDYRDKFKVRAGQQYPEGIEHPEFVKDIDFYKEQAKKDLQRKFILGGSE